MQRRLGGARAAKIGDREASDTRGRSTWRRSYLQKQLDAARVEAGAAASRFALLCEASGVDPGELARSADQTSLSAGRVRAFSVLLSRE